MGYQGLAFARPFLYTIKRGALAIVWGGDEQGRPLVVYHGTNRRVFTELNIKKTMPNGATCYVEEVRDEDKQLAVKTLYRIEGVTAESLVKESRRPTSETAPSAVRLI